MKEKYGSIKHVSRAMFRASIRNLKSPNGYSLMEVIMAMAIASIGFTGGLTLFRGVQNTLNVVTTTSQMQQGIRKGFETMTQELQGTSVNTIDISVPYAICFASAVENTGFALNGDGTPDWKNAVVYFMDEETNMLCRYVEAKDDWTTGFNTEAAVQLPNPEQLIPDVADLQFQLTGNLLSITMKISKEDPSDMSNTLSTQIYLRN